jgi:D-glycero-D-manno-heptose 1,7-bisphosphate phosphatase
LAKSKAVFLDRDGVINELVYNKEEGTIGGPLSAREMRVFPYAAQVIKSIQKLGYKVIVISNQPGVAKKQMTYSEFLRINKKMTRELIKANSFLDGEYYCMHHPYASISKYRVKCTCRKPKPGLIIKAAKEHDLDLNSSVMVGDGLVDVKAGRLAGCKTVLIAHMTEFLNDMIEKENARPDFLVASLGDVSSLLVSHKGKL